jgi:hypothetical protein
MPDMTIPEAGKLVSPASVLVTFWHGVESLPRDIVGTVIMVAAVANGGTALILRRPGHPIGVAVTLSRVVKVCDWRSGETVWTRDVRERRLRDRLIRAVSTDG